MRFLIEKRFHISFALVFLAFLQGKFFGYGIFWFILISSFLMENEKKGKINLYLLVAVVSLFFYEFFEAIAIFGYLDEVYLAYFFVFLIFLAFNKTNFFDDNKNIAFVALLFTMMFVLFYVINSNITINKNLQTNHDMVVNLNSQVDDYNLVLKDQICDVTYETKVIDKNLNIFTMNINVGEEYTHFKKIVKIECAK